MPKVARRTVLLGAIAALAIGLAVNTPGTASAQEKSTWDEVLQRGTVRMGAVNTAPWFVLDGATGKWSGLGVTVGENLAKALGVQLEIVEVQWGTSIPALQSKRIDFMQFIDPTPERAKVVDFPLGVSEVDIAQGVLIQDGMTADRWEQLDNEKTIVAVPQGTSMDQFITRRLPKATILRLPSNQEAVAAFQSGRANVASMFLPPLILLQQKIGRGKIVVPKPVHSSTSTVAFRAEPDKRFRDWVGTSISWWYHSGQMSQWFEQTLRELKIDPATVPGVIRSQW